jgi:signal transduction histidine kinase
VDYLDQVIDNVRQLSRHLSPSILEDLGLTAALRWLVDQFNKHNHVQASLGLIDLDPYFPPKSQIIIYRLIQEALTNIHKHAQAKRVMISVEKKEGGFSFVVEDDGQGFNVEEVAARSYNDKGLGLATMGGRVRMLGGSFEIKSHQGQGTQITFVIPHRGKGGEG